MKYNMRNDIMYWLFWEQPKEVKQIVSNVVEVSPPLIEPTSKVNPYYLENLNRYYDRIQSRRYRSVKKKIHMPKETIYSLLKI